MPDSKQENIKTDIREIKSKQAIAAQETASDTETSEPRQRLDEKSTSMKGMSFKNAVIHFWTYYKWWVIIPAIIIIILASFLNSFLKSREKGYLNIILVNAHYESDNYMFVDYAESIGEHIIVQSDYVVPSDTDTTETTQEMIANQQKIVTLLTEGVGDVFVTNLRSISEYGERGVLDLRTLLTPEQLASLESQNMLYYMDFENENHVPVAINITNHDYFLAAYEGSNENHYLFLSAYSNKTEEEKLLLEFLFFS